MFLISIDSNLIPTDVISEDDNLGPYNQNICIKTSRIIATLANASFPFFSTRYVLKEHRVGGK